MIDASTSTSLATRAKRLTALARARKDNAKEAQDLGQVQTALAKLDQELIQLRNVLGVRKELQRAGVPIGETPGLTAAPERLQEHLDTVGRPTAQFVNARTRDAASARAGLEGANTEAWRTWATERIGELPTAVLPRLPLRSRTETTKRIDGLRRTAGRPPAVADIIEFQQSYRFAEEELRSVEGATIDGVLSRFTDGRIRLADLSDPDLELLRQEEQLRDQLFLHLGP